MSHFEKQGETAGFRGPDCLKLRQRASLAPSGGCSLCNDRAILRSLDRVELAPGFLRRRLTGHR
jgi:hypothetical protein